MEIADALSRLSPEETGEVKGMDVQLLEICPQFSNDMIKRIKEATAADPELSALKEQTYIGWPSDIKGVPALIKPYWAFRDEISIDNGLMMKRHRIIIPKALQNVILLKLHASHQGTEKTKLRARSAFYWRDLNRDIDNVTKSCSICQEPQSKQAKEPLMPTEIPPRPWHTVSSDLFYLDGSKYLLVADYYSKFTFARKIPPRSPLKTTKKTLKKAKATNSDPYLALTCLRSTAIDGKLPSPAELLLGRPLQDNLPKRIQASPNNDDITERLEYRQERQRHYHDRGCKSLPDLAPGQPIRIQDPVSSTWKPATVKEKPDKVPRSYTVTTPAGQEFTA